jgi:hypothetical protein
MEKMDIFISWHGPRGKAVATELQRWLPEINNLFNPWLSAIIEKGARWRNEIGSRLANAKAGIICLTPSALTSAWVLFEAGAIAKFEKTHVCTLLVDLKYPDVVDPLAQFHHTDVRSKHEIQELVETLNNQLGNDARPSDQIRRSFEKWWPDLEQQLKHLPTDELAKLPPRDEREMLAELLTLTRESSLGVIASHQLIMQRLEQIEARQAFITPMPQLSGNWVSAAADVVGGEGEPVKAIGLSGFYDLSRKTPATPASIKNAFAARVINANSTTAEDKPKKK